MRRSDRLFDLVQILRDGRLHRAADLAQALGGVSVRTIWRDMGTLMASGMPIEGERGVGYILRARISLPSGRPPQPGPNRFCRCFVRPVPGKNG